MVDVEGRTVAGAVGTGVAKVEIVSFAFQQPVQVVVEELVGAKLLAVCFVQPFVGMLAGGLLAWFVA